MSRRRFAGRAVPSLLGTALLVPAFAILTIATLTIATLALHAPALAGPPCHDRAVVLARLAERYGELPAGAGLTAQGLLLELLRRPDGASWTVIVTRPDGQSCLVAAGEAWRERAPDPAAAGPET